MEQAVIQGLSSHPGAVDPPRDRHEAPEQRGDRFERLLHGPDQDVQPCPDGTASGLLAADPQLPGAAAAHIFNELGFFGSAVPMPGEAHFAVMPIAVEPAPAGEVDISRPADIPSFVATRAALVGALVAAGNGAAPVSGTAAARDSRPQVLAAPVAGAARAPAEPEDRETPPAATRPVAGARLRATAARSAVALAVHEIENGLHVAARLEALDAADRARLRDAIAALLARYGLAAKSIQINAPARRESSEQREYR